MNLPFIVPIGRVEIKQREFAENAELKTVVLPDGVERIGTGAFVNCRNLKYIFLPVSVKIIEADAFLGCDKAEIFCEGYVQPEWVDNVITQSVIERCVTPEDDAFNFHRSSGSFTFHEYERKFEKKVSWNPAECKVYEAVSPEEFLNMIDKTL